MFGLNPVILGLTSIFLGAGIFLLVFLLSRMIPRLKSFSRNPVMPDALAVTTSHNEAVLLIQSGGRLIYLNQQAREFFGAWGKEPGLESLARHTRPEGAFLGLCACEGIAQFSIKGRLVEGTSYFAPAGLPGKNGQSSPDQTTKLGAAPQPGSILVTLRRPQFVLDNDLSTGPANQENGKSRVNRSTLASRMLAGLSQEMASSLDLEATVQNILTSVERLLPSDSLEIAVWNADNQTLFPYQLVGLPDQENRLEKGNFRRPDDWGYSGYLIAERKSLLVEDANTFQPARPPLDKPGYPFQSYLGAPLLIAGELVGTLELASLTKESYNQGDLEIVDLLSGQAAAALNNALTYEKKNRQSTELAILANLAQAVSSIRNTHDLYSRLIEIISPIIQVEILGFLVYYEYRHALEGQAPFMGIPANVIELYSASIQPGTPAEAIWQSGEVIVATNAPEDSRLESLGLVRVMLAASIKHTVLVPLTSSGRMVGYLQAGNKRDGTAFDQDDLHLLAIIAGQTAPIVENSILVQLSRHRAQRAETLLRIIKELSISLDLDRVLRNTLQVLREYVDAEQITILIARPNQKKLHRLASVGYTPKPPSEGSPTPFDTDQGLAGWIIIHRESVLIEDVLQDERWIQVPYASSDEPENTPAAPGVSKKSRKKSPVTDQHRSALGVPLMSGAEVLGCLLLFHREVGHFSGDQLELVQAAATQVAVAVNNAELYRLIRDQAEDLGNMLRAQQVETSRSKAILEAVADGVLVTDAKRRITLFNESAERILGLDQTKVVGESMENFTGLFGKATHMWMETIRTWSQDPSTYQPGDVYSEQIILEDGRVVSVHLAPVSLGSDFLGTVSIFQDITHQVEVDRLKSEFVATVSHELRTPMTSIKGYIEILLMGAAGVLSEQQSHFLRVAKDNTERLAILVNDLLDISQIESGRITLSLQPLNLEYLADQAIADLKRRKEGDDKSITVTKEAEPSLPHILGDVERMQRVFDNLLENAYLYNTPGGKITVAIHRTGGEVQVDVMDTGVGIHPEDQERVFERFYRGENPLVLGVSGTGLGLPIVKNLIEMHNGRIWLESTGVPGKGSTFSFALPEIQSRKKGKNRKTEHG
jgi:PAS domain S-box-containing protein